MTLKMTKRERVCVCECGRREQEGQKGRGGELLRTLSYTYSLLYPSSQPCTEERAWGAGCQHRERKTDSW